MKADIRRRVIGIVLAMVILLPGVLAIGVAPASSEHRSLIDNNILFHFKVLNPDGEPTGAVLSVEGELAQHIVLSEQTVQFKKGETERRVVKVVNHRRPKLYGVSDEFRGDLAAL